MLLWAGYTYILIRHLTGSIIYPIIAHIITNIIIFLPKWIIAFLYFNNC